MIYAKGPLPGMMYVNGPFDGQHTFDGRVPHGLDPSIHHGFDASFIPHGSDMMFSNCPASCFCCLLFTENQVEVRVYDPAYCSMLVMAPEKIITYTTRILTCTSTCSEYTFRSFLSDANEKTDYLHYLPLPCM